MEKLGIFFVFNLMRPADGERDFVRKPIGNKTHAGTKNYRHP